MAFAEGLDVEEGEDALAFEELEGGDVACFAVRMDRREVFS